MASLAFDIQLGPNLTQWYSSYWL